MFLALTFPPLTDLWLVQTFCISAKKMRLELVPKRLRRGEVFPHSRKAGWRVGLGGDEPSAVERNPFRAELVCILPGGLKSLTRMLDFACSTS